MGQAFKPAPAPAGFVDLYVRMQPAAYDGQFRHASEKLHGLQKISNAFVLSQISDEQDLQWSVGIAVKMAPRLYLRRAVWNHDDLFIGHNVCEGAPHVLAGNAHVIRELQFLIFPFEIACGVFQSRKNVGILGLALRLFRHQIARPAPMAAGLLMDCGDSTFFCFAKGMKRSAFVCIDDIGLELLNSPRHSSIEIPAGSDNREWTVARRKQLPQWSASRAQANQLPPGSALYGFNRGLGKTSSCQFCPDCGRQECIPD